MTPLIGPVNTSFEFIQHSYLAVTTAVLAVLIPFATPSPNIASPTATPIMGPGITKFMFARGSIIRMMPLAASNPATTNDL
jgi:hypothetical protein